MNTTAQYPSLLMIIRHGEKPGDPSNDKDGGPHLSVLGSARAGALPSLFTPDQAAPAVANNQQIVCDLTIGSERQFGGEYGSSHLDAGRSRFPTPDFLFASRRDSASHRPVETITPLAQALQFFSNKKLTIDHRFTNDADGITGLTSEISDHPKTYGGQVVLICWHHGMIPQLTEAFGVAAAQLPWSKWPPTIFDLVFGITWPDGQATLTVDYQQLLFGDTSAPAGAARG